MAPFTTKYFGVSELIQLVNPSCFLAKNHPIYEEDEDEEHLDCTLRRRKKRGKVEFMVYIYIYIYVVYAKHFYGVKIPRMGLRYLGTLHILWSKNSTNHRYKRAQKQHIL